MTCTSDHTSLLAGQTCPECGYNAQPEGSIEATTETATPASFFASKKNQQITAVAAVVAVLLVGFIGFKVLKKSPAVPYLTSACAALNPVIFKETNKNEDEALLNSVESDINTAASLDAAAAAPFKAILSDMQTMIDATDANNMQFAIMLTLKNYSNLAKIQRELDRIIGLGEALEVDIDTACSGYTA